MSALDGRLFVGVDVGGSSVKAVVTDDARTVLSQVQLPTDASDATALLSSAATAVDRVLEDVGDAKTVAGIGIGVPGQVDPATGVVRMAMNLNIGDEGVPIGTSIGDRFEVDTTVENDVRAAAVGAFEVLQPRTPDLHTLVYLSIGTGVSAGVVVGGELFRDATAWPARSDTSSSRRTDRSVPAASAVASRPSSPARRSERCGRAPTANTRRICTERLPRGTPPRRPQRIDSRSV